METDNLILQNILSKLKEHNQEVQKWEGRFAEKLIQGVQNGH